MPACSSTKPARMRLMKASLGSASTNASGMMTSRNRTEKVRVPSRATNLVSPESSTPAAAQGTIAAKVDRLAATPFESDQAYWRAVIEARLALSELALAAAHAAMLHCGARGYIANATAQRRLRESYFVAIVTPAIKQLKKMLADMAH